MSLILNQRVVTASESAGRQWAEIRQSREIARRMHANAMRVAGLTGNAAGDLAPRFWLDMDTATVELIGQEADPLFTDLQALSRSVSIGKLVAAFRKLGTIDAGESSLNGQLPKLMGNVGASYDGVTIPVHSKAFGRQWREVEGQRSMGYDDLADDQQAAVREVIRLITVNWMTGTPNAGYQGFESYGLINNPNTKAVELAVDFSDPATTFAEMQPAFVAFTGSIRSGDNRVSAPGTIYVSPEIETNMLRTSGPTAEDRTFLRALSETPGVESIKTSWLLTGNQMLYVVRNRQFIQPVTGMAITTTPIPRHQPMADHQFLTWAASAIQVKADEDGRTGVAFGTSA